MIWIENSKILGINPTHEIPTKSRILFLRIAIKPIVTVVFKKTLKRLDFYLYNSTHWFNLT